MKLGDNMTMEACNVWGEVAPRKCRPPRIGDIPKHGAVDEESPGSSAKKLTLSPSEPPDVGVTTDTSTTASIQQQLLSSGKIAQSIIGNFTPVYQKELDARKANIDPAIKISLSSANEFTKLKIDTRSDVQDTLRVLSSPEDNSDSKEIQEIRKDSALFLEETEGLPTLREILKSSSNTRRIVRPRRESSGYASNLGTFDEDRRNSSTNDAQQDLTTFLKESRRSSTKKLNSRILIGRTESVGEETSIGTSEKMPTTDIHRKVSSTGLDMSNIVEVKEVLRKETRQKSLENLCRIVEAADVEQLSVRSRFAKDTASQTSSQRRSNVAPSIVNVSSTLNESKSSKVTSQEPLDTSNLKESLHRVTSETILRLDVSDNPKKEKLHEISLRSYKNLSHPAECTTSKIVRESIHVKPEERNREKHLGDRNSTYEDAGYARALLKPVKVYQLLSTQSEDCGDNEPQFTDRRISLQIPGHEENEGILNSSSECENNSAKCSLNISVSSSSSSSDDVQYTRYEDSTIANIPARKFVLPSEAIPPQRFPGDTGNVTIRPIYPYCPYSPYGSPQGSPRNRRRPLRESRRVSIDNRQGTFQLNQYKLLDNIGQGSYGIVKLAYNEEDEIHYAMKILSKRKLMKKAGIFGRMAPGKKSTTNPLAKLYREIALLKKLDHPNVVKLVEVLDDPDEDNLYLVFELVQKGEILQLPTDKPLDEQTARKNFRDIVMGVEYLHYQRIVHRDIKPSNLLVDSEGRIKIADLGVSAELRASGELLSGPAGTPAFAAPETTTPGSYYSGTQCDVWSMGVTLFSLVTGRVPWNGSGTIISVQAAVRSEPLRFPEELTLSTNLRDIISRMLAKCPNERITLSEIKKHPWLTNEGAELLPSEADNCRLPVTVTDEEVERVVTRVPKLDTLILIKTMLKQHSFQNPFLPKRIVSNKTTACNDGETSGMELPTAGRIGVASQHEAMRNAKTERFHRSGRSNSAPDSYDWHTNGRQISMDSPLPPVTEVLSSEAEIEKR